RAPPTKTHSRATNAIPPIPQHIRATRRVVEARLSDVAIARVVDRAANIVIAELRVRQTNGKTSRAERVIQSNACPILVSGLKARPCTRVRDEWFVGRTLAEASAEAAIPRADWPRDGDSTRRAEPSSHVRDGKGEKICADP